MLKPIMIKNPIMPLDNAQTDRVKIKIDNVVKCSIIDKDITIGRSTSVRGQQTHNLPAKAHRGLESSHGLPLFISL